jgi:hypothetical protein
MFCCAWKAAATAAVVLVLVTGAAFADCRMSSVIGQWQLVETDARWAFFSDKRLDCRVCKEWQDGQCRYVPDAKDGQGRKQCVFTGAGWKGEVRVTGWKDKNGKLDQLVFSDGSTRSIGSCSIDGPSGIMKIEGLGNFQCNYNFHCNKLERQEPGAGKPAK